MEQPPARSWIGRNWKWALPLGCLLPFVAVGGCVAVLVVSVFGLLKSSDAYNQSLAAVRADREVQAALGEPIEPSFLVQGNINISGQTGHADISYDVSGPKGKATVYVVADKVAGQWTFTTLICEIGATGERIDLRTDSNEEDATDLSV